MPTCPNTIPTLTLLSLWKLRDAYCLPWSSTRTAWRRRPSGKLHGAQLRPILLENLEPTVLTPQLYLPVCKCCPRHQSLHILITQHRQSSYPNSRKSLGSTKTGRPWRLVGTPLFMPPPLPSHLSHPSSLPVTIRPIRSEAEVAMPLPPSHWLLKPVRSGLDHPPGPYTLHSTGSSQHTEPSTPRTRLPPSTPQTRFPPHHRHGSLLFLQSFFCCAWHLLFLASLLLH